MRALISVFIAMFILNNVVITRAEANTENDLPLYSTVYDDKRDPFKDAVSAIKLAKATDRNVLLEIGGNWCTWCHKMDDFLAKNPDIYKKLHDEYVLLKINVSDSNENEAFMKSLPPTLGYPHMYVSTATGKMILSKDTAELLSDGDYSRVEWIAFLEKWKLANNQLNIKKNEAE
ncbi:MAG: thioredoxin family protein [Colwelliaceae bacterium]|nr:thioredoxin family protein [Colwelliaceae bacterium]